MKTPLFGPGLGRDLVNLTVGHVRKAGEDITKVVPRVNLATAAALDNRVNDRAALASLCRADEKPVLLPDGRRANGVFNQVVVDLQTTVTEENLQCRPLAQGVIDGLAQQTLRQVSMAGFEKQEGLLQPSGSVDPIWDPNVPGAFGAPVYALALNGAELFVGGSFHSIGGLLRACLKKAFTR